MDCPVNVAARGGGGEKPTLGTHSAFVLFLFVELLFVFRGCADRMLIHRLLPSYQRVLFSSPLSLPVCLWHLAFISSKIIISSFLVSFTSSLLLATSILLSLLLSSPLHPLHSLNGCQVGRRLDIPCTEYPLLSSPHFSHKMLSFILTPATHGNIYWRFYFFFPPGPTSLPPPSSYHPSPPLPKSSLFAPSLYLPPFLTFTQATFPPPNTATHSPFVSDTLIDS